ncbi:DUF4190 domain-containing protein [Streptomyces sp. YIM 98790]|uniref:DUF4190 domain-containing protein n=1 Tax=Streptomyces sp. YIM 98790 TaxID=2689077 RepID=UPI001408C7D5|nr:DUF4190 domain-containing protein [Streptomyces sp. YIM 98790]
MTTPPSQPPGSQPPWPPQQPGEPGPPGTPAPQPGPYPAPGAAGYGHPRPGPPGPPPYPGQPGPPPWGMPPEPQKTNGLAVGSLVAAVLFMIPVALILGIIALVQLNSRPGRGKGLAVAGVVLASLELVVLSVAVPVALFASDEGRPTASSPEERESGRQKDGGDSGGGENGPGDGRKPAEGETIQVFDLSVGDCFESGKLEDFAEEEGGEQTTVTLVSCEDPHESEVFGSLEVEGYTEFPGDEVMAEIASTECAALMQPYVIDTWAQPLDMYFFHPVKQGWRFGDREVLCFFAGTGGSELTGSVRADATGYDARQLRFLELTAPVEATWVAEPVAEDHTLHQEWAGRLAEEMEQYAAALRAESWDPEVAGLVTALADVREESARQWRRAAAAGEDTYPQHYDEGAAAYGFEEEFAVREALQLATGE